MRKLLLMGLVALAGCQTAPTQTEAREPRLLQPPNSKERFQTCAAQHRASTKAFADCWEGKSLTRQEICKNGSDLLDSPYLSEWKKMQLYETMRNYGCMGGR